MNAKGREYACDDTTDDVNYAVQLHIKGSTETIVNAIEKEAKTNFRKLSDGQDAIVDKLQANTNIVLATIKDEAYNQTKEFREDAKLIIENQHAVVDVVNSFTEKHAEVTNAVLEQSKKQSDRADHSEHISYQLRGQLGVQGRKRRREDLEEIGRLRNEVGVLKRQNRDKDQAVKALSAHVMSLEDKMKEMMTTK